MGEGDGREAVFIDWQCDAVATQVVFLVKMYMLESNLLTFIHMYMKQSTHTSICSC